MVHTRATGWLKLARVLALAAVSAHAMWIAHAAPVHAQTPATPRFTHLTAAQGLSHNTVKHILSLSSDDVLSIYEDSWGTLWIGTSGGLDALDRATGRFTRYRHDPADPHSLSYDRVAAIKTALACSGWEREANMKWQ